MCLTVWSIKIFFLILKTVVNVLCKPQNFPCHLVLKTCRIKLKLLHAFSLLSLPAVNLARRSHWGFPLFLLLPSSASVFQLYPILYPECPSQSYPHFAWLIPAQHFRLDQVLIFCRSPSLNTPTISAARVHISTIPLYLLRYNYLHVCLPSH